MARKWISVKDRLPEPDEWVEVLAKASMWSDGVRQHWTEVYPTHWRPAEAETPKE